METILPAGSVTMLENVNGRNARRLIETEKKRRTNHHPVLGALRQESNRRREQQVAVHLVNFRSRRASFSDHGIDLVAEGFDIFGMGKEAVQDLCDSRLALSRLYDL